MFSTMDINKAVNGDIDGEKLRLTREQADKLELENKQSRKELMPCPEISQVVQRGLYGMVEGLKAIARLTDEEKAQIIKRANECGKMVERATGHSCNPTSDLPSKRVG